MEGITISFNAREILNQIHRELIKVGADLETIPADQWKQYIFTRAIEDVLLIELTPVISQSMENISTIIQSNYHRHDGDNFLTLHQDVGNKLYPYLGSTELPFESKLELHGYRITIGPR